MDFKLIWSESSIADLAGIVRYIALREGSQIARQIGFGIYDRAQILTRHPEAGSVLSEKQDYHPRTGDRQIAGPKGGAPAAIDRLLAPEGRHR